MDCQDSIQVVIRVRPHSNEELSVNDFLTYSDREIRLGRNSFAFDRIFSVDSQQQDIFNQVGIKLVHHSLEGYNSCVFAYGQTGSGKTHTMVGSGDGIIQRSIEQLFLRVNAAAASNDYSITCSYFEIYNEQLVDLLDQSPKKLIVREDVKKGVFVDGLWEEPVENVLMAVGLLNQGIRNRHIGETQMNRQSSRSHAVFSLNITNKLIMNGECLNVRSSKLHFVDLAGSERQKSTACAGERLKEASNINKSLTTLGMVINSLSGEKHRVHIPFRDSKLTFVLRDSLSGNSKTFIIATISSMPSSFQQSLSTLKFAQRAKMVKLSAHINEESLSMNAEVLKAEIKRLKDELFRIKHELQEEKAKNSSPAQLQKNHFSELILNSYNRGVSEINEKINSLLELIPAVTSENSLVERLARQLGGDSDESSQKNVLVEYLSSNSNMLRNINDNLNAFVSLRQEIRAKASVEKLRMEELRTPHKVDREQMEQFSNAKNQELCEIKKTALELRNELTEKDIYISELSRNLERISKQLGSSNEQNRHLKGYYEAKQSQLMLMLENHSATGDNFSAHDYSEDIRTLLSENKHILEESTATISKLRNQLKIKVHEIDMLCKSLLTEKKANNQLSVDRDAIEGQLRLLQMDYDLLRADSLSLEERLETYTRGDNYTQKSMEQLLAQRRALEDKYNEQFSNLKEQAELNLAETNNKLEALTETNSQLFSDIEVLTETVQFKNNQLSKLEEQIRVKEEELQLLRRHSEELIAEERASSKMQIEAISGRLNEEQQQRAAINGQVQHYQQLIACKQEELAHLKQQHSLQTSELRQLNAELLAESRRLEEQRLQVIEHYKLTVCAQEQEVEALKCAYLSERDLLQQSIHDHKRHEADQRSKLTQHYEEQLAQRCQTIEQLRSQLGSMKCFNELNVSTIRSLEQVIKESRNLLNSEINKWKQSLMELTQTNQHLQLSIDSLTKENGIIKSQLTSTWGVAEKFRANSEQLESTLSELRAQVTQGQANESLRSIEIEKLQHELNATKDQLEKSKNSRQVKLTSLQKKYDELRETSARNTQQLASRIERERQQIEFEANNKLKQVEEARCRAEREVQKVVDWKNLMESEFQAVHTEDKTRIEQLSKEQIELRQKHAEIIETLKSERTLHQQEALHQTKIIAKLQSELAEASKQLYTIEEVKNRQIQVLRVQAETLNGSLAALQQDSLEKQQMLHAESARITRDSNIKIEQLESELAKIKSSCLTLDESQSMKARLNEVLVTNYKLKSKHGQHEEQQDNPSRLEAKIVYYEEKFNLMKIQYSNSVETVRKLKQREMEVKELNCQLEEKLRAAQMELEMNTKHEVESKLLAENEELRAALAQVKPLKEEQPRVTRREAKEGKENTLQLQNLKKDKQTLSETLQLIRTKMLAILSGMSELVTEEPQQELLKKEINHNLRERDEAKQMVKTLSLFEEVLKKKEGSLYRNIRKEEKLKSQNSFIFQENIFLKQRIKELEGNTLGEASSSAHKKVKRA